MENTKQKPVFNILFVSDKDSYLNPLRGESVIRNFADFYRNHATISYSTVNARKLANYTLNEIDSYNVLFIDNLSDFDALRRISDIIKSMETEISPQLVQQVTNLQKDGKETEAIELIKSVKNIRKQKLKVIYQLDEWIWEAPLGRARDINSAQIIETYINLADDIIVPTPELKEAITHYKFIVDDKKPIWVINTALNMEMFQLFRDFTRKSEIHLRDLQEKPKILIKGISIPDNVQEFIKSNYKKYKFTVASVSELDNELMEMLRQQKVSHIYHWANPHVNKYNITATYAIERDGSYDFVIHTKPDDLTGNIYEITTGDEDMLLSIATGAIPISGIGHLGYDDGENSYLGASCGIQFDNNTTPKQLKEMIESHMVAVKFNETFNKCRAYVENRIITSPLIISRYFSLFLNDADRKARIEATNTLNEEQTQQTDNIISVDFGGNSDEK